MVEVTSAIARLERAGQVSSARASKAMSDLMLMPLHLLGHRMLAAAAWRLRGSIRVTDAFYLASAAAVDAPLVTCDGRLGRAPTGGVQVEVIA